MDIYREIEKFQQVEEYYYVDYIPDKCCGDRFHEFEEFFWKHYTKEYVHKITKIVLTMLAYSEAHIVMTEFPEEYIGEYRYICEEERDIASESFEFISKVIEFVLTKEVSSVQVLLGEKPEMLVSIYGKNSIEIISASDNKLNLVRQLVEREGLYFKRYVESDE